MKEERKKILHSRPLFYSFLALLLSISATRFIFQLNVTYLVLIFVSILTLLIVLLYFKNFYLFLIIFAVILLGVCLFFAGVKSFEGEKYIENVRVEARITDDILNNDGKPQYKLVDVKIDGKSENNMQVIIHGYGQRLQVGDIITFEAPIENLNLFNLGNFNLSYYRDNSPYFAEIKIEDVKVISNHLKLDEKFRLKVKDLLYESMGVDNGATAFAILFGSTNDINDDIYDSYQNSGILHLLAVSGLNVTFLVALLGFFLKLLKINRWTNFLVCFFVLFIYIYLCGFAPSIVRAGIMGIIFLATSLSGKCYDGLNTLGLAGILTILFSPLTALDNGFLMSYFCVLGLYTIHPVLSTCFRKFLPKVIADSFSVAISSQIMILPFMASFYSNFNFLSFFLNLIVVPIFSVLYPFLFVVAVISVALPSFDFLLVLCGFVLSFVLLCADFFGLTSLLIPLKPFNAVVSALFFVLLFSSSSYLMLSYKNKPFFLGVILSLLLSTNLIFNFAPVATKPSIVYSYNFGYDIITFTNTRNKTLAIDGGYFSNLNNALNTTNSNDVVCHIALNHTLSQGDMEKLDASHYFYNSQLSAYEGCEMLDARYEYSIEGFKFKAIEYGGIIVGLDITFDNFSIFVLNEKGGYVEELAKILNEQNFDYLILGDISDALIDFGDAVVISYDNAINSDLSYVENGSMLLKLEKEGYILRRCD